MTWRRNANFKHGRWSRYRRRLEARLDRAEREALRYVRRAPPYAPYAGIRAWADLGFHVSRRVRYLQRRVWALVVARLLQIRLARSWLREYDRRLQAGLDGPPPVMTVLATLLAGLPRAP